MAAFAVTEAVVGSWNGDIGRARDGAEGAALGLVHDEVAADDLEAAVGPVEADVAGAVGVQDGVADDEALAGADAGVVLGVGAGLADDGLRRAAGLVVDAACEEPVVATRAAETQPRASAEARVGFMHVLPGG